MDVTSQEYDLFMSSNLQNIQSFVSVKYLPHAWKRMTDTSKWVQTRINCASIRNQEQHPIQERQILPVFFTLLFLQNSEVWLLTFRFEIGWNKLVSELLSYLFGDHFLLHRSRRSLLLPPSLFHDPLSNPTGSAWIFGGLSVLIAGLVLLGGSSWTFINMATIAKNPMDPSSLARPGWSHHPRLVDSNGLKTNQSL